MEVCAREMNLLCQKLSAPENVVTKAQEYLRKLNRKTNNYVGQADMFKYLICIELAYRFYDLSWEQPKADALGAKAKSYSSSRAMIASILGFQILKSFDELCEKFKCEHISNRFQPMFEKYCQRKLQSLPSIQKSYINFGQSIYKAAVFYTVAKEAKVGFILLHFTFGADLEKFEALLRFLLCQRIFKKYK
ncbi:hypothetical protein RFI_29176 [Reticulomyxa filosa]|uniref:Uncharacterized protein n=1 Tax=Reticulomyxa filosa TaxID=46433 RepID=X6M2R2_RETFI|nr:hypothetical protein RFI_29176 [Reticulomyxa filosa]|eukprot:ETO08214.1 hypothetical protein RFI_29176 [Reticulomyxa filosa]